MGRERPQTPANCVGLTRGAAFAVDLGGYSRRRIEVIRPRAMTKAQFLTALTSLVSAYEGRTGNEACVECVGCERCRRSTFCRGSKALVGCHYCVDCERCSASTHCRSSRDLTASNHCVACERCTDCAFLVRSVDCTGCTYCFGCVGLWNKEFHILNEPYERAAYFALASRLSRDLGLG